LSSFDLDRRDSSPESVLSEISDIILNRGGWGRKQNRLFHRAMSGLEYSSSHGESVLSLMLSGGSDESEDRLSADFQVLRKSIFRHWGVLVQYFRVRARNEPSLANRGHPLAHLHVLMKGLRWVAQDWISVEWERIHGAPVVFIRKVADGLSDRKKVASYVAGYMGHHPFSRMSWSWGWVFKGFVGFYREHFLKVFSDVKERVARWNWYLRFYLNPISSIQSDFGG
jgi:hypothetical protein